MCAWFVILKNSILDWERLHGQYQAAGCFSLALYRGRFWPGETGYRSARHVQPSSICLCSNCTGNDPDDHYSSIEACFNLSIDSALGGIYLVLWSLFLGQFTSLTVDKLQVAIIELVLVTTGVMLAHGLARHITQVEDTIESLAFGEIPGRATFLEDAAEAIKVELTRSRRYNHPLTVLVLEPDPETLQASLQRTLQEIKLNMAKRYANARLCQIVNEAARRTDLVLQQAKNGRFVILCPETEPQASTILASRIQSLAHDHLGISIAWGAAAFPAEAVTFDELLQKAELKLLAPTAHPIPAPPESAGMIEEQSQK